MTFLFWCFVAFFVGGAVYMVATPPASKFEQMDNLRRKLGMHSLCKHRWRLYRTIHGDEANYARSEWRCVHCDKHRYSQHPHEMT